MFFYTENKSKKNYTHVSCGRLNIYIDRFYIYTPIHLYFVKENGNENLTMCLKEKTVKSNLLFFFFIIVFKRKI